MIRLAFMTDLDAIMRIVKETIELMHLEDNPQWDESYPARSDFLSDIEDGNLYVYVLHDEIAGFACINCDEPSEYLDLPWSCKKRATVIHRMAIQKDQRRNGIGIAFFQFAEEIAIKNNTYYLKTDTYGNNEKMNALMKKQGYKFKGHMHFKGKDGLFSCYDKQIG